MSQIMGETLDRDIIDQIAAQWQPPDTMTLLDVAQLLHTFSGTKPDVWEVSYLELVWLDRPHIIHTRGSGCSECPEGGHVAAVERLAGDWAIVVQARGTYLVSAGWLRDTYRGHAILLARPPFIRPSGPHLVLDSYVSDLGTIGAGQSRLCHVVMRNEGTEPLRNIRVECDESVRCLSAPAELGPGETAMLEISLCPTHRLDRPLDTRTYFVYIYSNDPVRPRTSAALRCAVVEPVIVECPVVYFPRVTAGQSAERTISLECRPPVELTGASSTHRDVTAEVTQTGSTVSGTQYQVRIVVTGDSLTPGLVELPIALQLKGVESKGAQLIARVRVWPVAGVEAS